MHSGLDTIELPPTERTAQHTQQYIQYEGKVIEVFPFDDQALVHFKQPNNRHLPLRVDLSELRKIGAAFPLAEIVCRQFDRDGQPLFCWYYTGNPTDLRRKEQALVTEQFMRTSYDDSQQ